jgi:hypothetical protein
LSGGLGTLLGNRSGGDVSERTSSDFTLLFTKRRRLAMPGYIGGIARADLPEASLWTKDKKAEA